MIEKQKSLEGKPDILDQGLDFEGGATREQANIIEEEYKQRKTESPQVRDENIADIRQKIEQATSEKSPVKTPETKTMSEEEALNFPHADIPRKGLEKLWFRGAEKEMKKFRKNVEENPYLVVPYLKLMNEGQYEKAYKLARAYNYNDQIRWSEEKQDYVNSMKGGGEGSLGAGA